MNKEVAFQQLQKASKFLKFELRKLQALSGAAAEQLAALQQFRLLLLARVFQDEFMLLSQRRPS